MFTPNLNFPAFMLCFTWFTIDHNYWVLYFRRQIRATCRSRRLGARNHGLCKVRTIRPDLPTRQLCVRTERRWQQLGQGSLHRGCWTRRLRPWRSQKGSWELWLSPGIPADPLPRWRYRLWHGHTSHLQDPWGIPRQNHEHILSCTITKGNYCYMYSRVQTLYFYLNTFS